MSYIRRTPSAMPGRCGALVRASSRTARHGIRRTWSVECLEERTLLSQFSVTNLSDGGGGSLRQAIVDSNHKAGPNEIDFVTGLSGTIALTSGDLMIANNSVTILGPGQGSLSVSSNGSSRVFEVASGVTASLSGMTITGGKADKGGGISNAGTLVLNGCAVTNNTATSANSLGGGGIYNLGTLTINVSTISGNRADNEGGAILDEGNNTSAIGCTFSGNSSYRGGAVSVYGSLSAINCTFSGNSSLSGAAIEVPNLGTLRLTNCTLFDNSAGGVYVGMGSSFFSTDSIYQNPEGGSFNVFPGADLYMTSRVVHLPAGSFWSGGHNLFSDAPTTPQLDPTDLVNTDPLLGPLADYGGPTFTQALLPGSPAIDAGVAVTGVTTDQRGLGRVGAVDIGAFESQGFALTLVAGSTPQTSQVGTAFANPLAVIVTANNAVEPVNGGVIHFANTVANGAAALFAAPSSVIDGGQAAAIAYPDNAVGGYNVVASASGSSPVSFALSNEGPVFTSLVVNTTIDSLAPGAGLFSLRTAIDFANYDSSGNSSITFDPTAFATAQTITLTGTQLELANTLEIETITGPAAGLTVSGGGLSRVFQVDGGAITSLSGLTILGGRSDNGAGLYNLGGTLTLADITVSGNHAGSDGGGLYNSGGTTTLTNCSVTGNSAAGSGGGLYATGSGGATTLSECTVSGNSAGAGGGGLENHLATVTLTSSTLSGNSADTSGGIDNSSTMTLTNCTVSGNTSTRTYGGGIGGIDNSGTMSLTACTVAGNTVAESSGIGGVIDRGKLTTLMSLFANPDRDLVIVPSATFVSMGHNLFSDDSGQGARDPSDLVNTDPLLGPLADNGGPTLTQALLYGSPAVDAGVSVPGLTTDQRGVLRPEGNGYDIGAFELELSHTAFDSLAAPSISYGTATVTLSGKIDAGPQIPTGSVMITLNSIAQPATIDPSTGSFSAVFAAAGLHVSSAPYVVTYHYAWQGDWAATTATRTLTVTPAALVITANDTSVAFGSAPRSLTATYSGFVSGDSISSLVQPLILSTTAAAYSPPGRYEISATGAASVDYAITFVNGWLTVAQPKTHYEQGCVAIVTTLYHDILGRAAEPAGLRFWMGRMKAGARVVNITRQFWTSAEHRTLVHNHAAPKITLSAAFKHALSAGRKAARSKA